MSDGATLPPARERNRYGLRHFGDRQNAAREALLDRVELRVRGTITSRSDDGLARFADRVSTGAAATLFGRMHRRGGRWEAACLSGSTISSGELAVSSRSPDGWLNLTLVVNPTRTLGHLLDTYRFEEVGDLAPAAFFALSPNPTAADHTLDGRDNMVPDLLAFAGTWHAMYLQRVATYLRTFEAALKAHVIEELCPPKYGYSVREEGGLIDVWNDDVHLALDWGALTVSQCEVCWERHDPAALDKVHTLAQGVLAAARSATISTHELGKGAWVERELGAVSVKVPIVKDRVTLGIYAKAQDRLRFEVRYNSNLPDEVRERLPRGPRTLTDWFDAIRDEAAPRVPWQSLPHLLRPVENLTIDALAELLEAVADVTERAKSKRAPLLRHLLLQGAVTATNRDGDAPSAVLERLEARGVVEHVRLVGKDAKRGRRYCLSSRFAPLVTLAHRSY
jgi:hypothetical protein